MPPRHVTLEPSKGPTIPNPTRQQIHDMLSRIGKDLNHCILTLGSEDEFVQAAGEENRLLIQYRDATGMFESLQSDLSVETVERTFQDALSGNASWKTELGFRFVDAPAPKHTHASAGPAAPPKSAGQDAMDSVKRAAKDAAKRAVKSGLRGLFGGK